MTLILSGTDGLSDIDGSAATPAIRGTDTNTGIFFPAADTIAFSEGGVESMRIDSSGNMGIGTSSPLAKLNVVTTGGKSTVAIGDQAASTYSQVLMYGGSGKYNWSIGAQYNLDNTFEITRSTATGGTTFSTPSLAIDSSGNFQFNSGYGSVATAYGCRAWVNFDGSGVVAIRASGNVSSITDNGTGDYTVNFTTAMSAANYSVVGACGDGSTGSFVLRSSAFTSLPTTSAVRISTANSAFAGTDAAYVSIAIFR